MRIAIIAPPWLPIPPPAYGGTENVLDSLASGLQAAGHDVLLCTTGDSTCDVPRMSVFDHAIGIGAGSSVDEIRHVINAYEAAHDVDIIHDHTLIGPLYSAALPELALVTTNHGPFNAQLVDLYRVLAPRVPVIAISAHQASTATGIDIAAVIHHGVDIADFPIGLGGHGAVFLGRMHPGKAPHIAARIARKAGIPLRIAAKMREPDEIAYFETMVRPLLGHDISYVGELNRADKLKILGEAECLLNPIAWPEPFGMVMIEALACGTPVITTSFGAAPEIVRDGIDGYVCDDEATMLVGLQKIPFISRSSCRQHIASTFSIEIMVRKHLAVYEQARAARIGAVHFHGDELIPGAA